MEGCADGSGGVGASQRGGMGEQQVIRWAGAGSMPEREREAAQSEQR